MTVHFNVPGKKRKELATEVAAWLGEEVHYCGAPTFAYEIDRFQIDRDGNLICSDLVDAGVIERLLQHLYDMSFEMDISAEAPTGVAIQIPASQVNTDNLAKILDAKGSLVKKALGVEDLHFGILEDRVDFPWFKADTAPDELNAYMHFVTALCEMSKNQKRITATEKNVENEKYAFRCFLLRLGFIGNDYKAERKILLRNLSGSSAFKGDVKMQFPNKEIVERVRNEYPVGTRVELVKMDDVQAPPIGTRGTVRGVDDIGSIMVRWDNGCGLSVAYGEDICRRIEE